MWYTYPTHRLQHVAKHNRWIKCRFLIVFSSCVLSRVCTYEPDLPMAYTCSLLSTAEPHLYLNTFICLELKGKPLYMYIYTYIRCMYGWWPELDQPTCHGDPFTDTFLTFCHHYGYHRVTVAHLHPISPHLHRHRDSSWPTISYTETNTCTYLLTSEGERERESASHNVSSTGHGNYDIHYMLKLHVRYFSY